MALVAGRPDVHRRSNDHYFLKSLPDRGCRRQSKMKFLQSCLNMRSVAPRLFGTARSWNQATRYTCSVSNINFVNQSSGNSTTLWFKTGIASVGLISAAFITFDQHERKAKCDLALSQPSSPASFLKVQRRRSTGGKGDSASFQILQALEVKEEFQKIRAARFLREIHQLALEESRQGIGLRKRRSTVGIKRRKTKQGEISLRNVDLQNLSRKSEAEYQRLLREGRKLNRDSILKLTDASAQCFLQDETVVDLRKVSPQKVTVVGDLHGSLKCLDRVLDLAGELEDPDHYLVFCGDYVDRGENSLEVFCSLLFLKLAYPKNVIMLRGNHEDVLISSVYGYQDEIRKKYGPVDADHLWTAMSLVFSSLPICARTEHAMLVHAGLPSRDFNLSDIEDISAEERSKIDTVVEPTNQREKHLEGLLWSDPATEDGVVKNPRGCGILFGPDVAGDFMDRHDLKYIIRSHEPSEQGAHGMSCGDGKWVVTVFSTAMYPNGEGSNMGAVVCLDKAGGMKPIQFTYEDHESGKPGDSHPAYEDILVGYIAENRTQLEAEFRKLELGGVVSTQDWARVMSNRLEMPDAVWISLQKTLAPTTTPNGNYINWKHFLNRFNPNLDLDSLGEEQVALLHEHHEKLLSLFKVLDVDGNGSIDQDEFISGIEMLNKTCLGNGEQFDNPEELFKTFDLDGNGEIDLDEFKSVLDQSKTLSNLTGSVDHHKIQALRQNQEMLLAAFHFLDRDGSGTIDRVEFKRGIDLLNKRLPEERQFGDPDDLFNIMDGDDSGEIDIDEFSQILHQMVTS